MMLARRLLAVVLIAALGGCSQLAVNSDYDPSVSFADLRTYEWRPGPPVESPDPRFNQTLFESRLRHAVDKELAAKGYDKLTSGRPDFFVTYDAVLEREVDVQTVGRAYGHGPGVVGPRGRYGGHRRGWGGAQWETETYTYEYNYGTLILDVVDAKTMQPIWRGSAKSTVDFDASPQKRQERIEKAVKEILNSFPPQ